MLAVLVAMMLGTTTYAHAQYEQLYFELFAPDGPFRVGDTIAFRAKVTGPPQMSPAEPAPRLAAPLPAGVRLVRADSMVKIANGHFEGTVVFQFFATGTRQVPELIVRLRRIGADRGNPVPMHADPVEISPLLPSGGEPRLADLRPPVPMGPPVWPFGLGLGALLVVLVVWLRRRLAAAQAERPAAIVVAPVRAPLDARAAALARLDDLVAEGLARRGEIARHYAETTDVLRDFLHDVRTTPRARGTTDELLAELARNAGIPAPLVPLLTQADFVKFARVRPDAGAADAYLDAVREIIAGWQPAAELVEA